jgi:hypothetical protein
MQKKDGKVDKTLEVDTLMGLGKPIMKNYERKSEKLDQFVVVIIFVS